MLQFENSYFEDEIRDGFYVPAMIKKAWAAELTVMHEVDKICQKYNITYFADWGTMLGAVRHGGFIPWDDDLDIMMQRKDYNRFLKVAEKELPEGFTILNMNNTENFWYFLSRVVIKPHICFEEEHLKRFHGFPYIAGIDIFILDTMSSDMQKEKEREKMIEYILAVADSLGTKELSAKKKKLAICRIEQICRVKIKRTLSDLDMKKQLYQLVQKLMTAFEGDSDGNCVQLIPDAVYYGNIGFPQEYYQNGVQVPFENIQLMLPARYEIILRRKYGNYMQLIHTRAGHNYPFFQSQKEDFEKILGYQLPQYKYPGTCPKKNTRELSYKYRVKECLRIFEQLHENLYNKVHLLETCIAAQENAIEMGNLIDQVKGDGHPLVSKLEQYCETIYELYNQSSEENGDVWNEKVKNLNRLKNTIGTDAEESIFKRKEAVFLPFSGKHWASLHSIWESFKEKTNWDVSVVPLPYYYKEYDGSFLDMVYNVSEYPQQIPLINYETFNIALHHPDIIFIQNPYDEWNSSISIPEEYYSSEIRNYTEQLIYIPYFELAEFNKESERQYWNMKYYCTVPGVVNADKVFVQSPEMKKVYVDKLTEFAGEDTRDMWAKKIVKTDSFFSDNRKKIYELDISFPPEWKYTLKKPNGERKKVILFFVSMSALIQYKEKIIEKIERVSNIALENYDDITFIWKEDSMIDLNKKIIGETLCTQYQKLRQEIVGEKRMICAGHMKDDLLVDLCDGYYGMPSAVGNKFQVLCKPIMICNIN